jgi:membrane dipeptidase
LSAAAPGPPVFDGHNDALLRLHEAGDEIGGFLHGNADGHLDLPRAVRGGFSGGLFAAFVPGAEHDEPDPDVTSYALPLAAPIDPVYARETTEALVSLLLRVESAGGLRIVRSSADVDECFAESSIAAVLHFEGAEAIDGPSELEAWYERGLRSLGPVWSRPNRYGEGVPFRFPDSPDTGPGLTRAGRALVRECNRLGILVHLTLRGFFDVASLSDAPLVASHSNAHALCASTRNLTDEQLDAIASSGGLVGINFAVGFLRPDGRLDTATPLDVVVDHVDYLVARMGIDHVGFGSDFDGARIPNDLGDAGGLPLLIDALRARGYDEEALTKLAHGNWRRVLHATWGV